jgi:hypothetical protein
LLFQEALILANREETQKQYNLALVYFGKAAQLQPENQEVQKRLSELSRRLGRAPASKRAEKGIPP